MLISSVFVEKTGIIQVANIYFVEAFIFHLFSILVFIFGFLYGINFKLKFNYKIEKKYIIVSDKYFTYSYVLLVIGLVVSVLRISYVTSLSQYFSNLLAGNAYFITLIREDSNNGGLPGIFKLFAFAPLTVYMVTVSLLNFFNCKKTCKAKLKKLTIISLIITIVKVVLSLDRLTILAIVVSNLYILMRKEKILSLRNVILFLFVFLFANFISSSRLSDYSIFDFIILYSKLGIVNFQNIMNQLSFDNYTFGFSTFFAPLSFILNSFGYSVVSDFQFIYEWNPANYFNSYLFIDFGYFSIFIYFIIGLLLSLFEKQFEKNSSKWYALFVLPIVFYISTSIFVPAIRGIESWFSVLIVLFLGKLIKICNDEVVFG